MGRIKTQLVKRITQQLVRDYPDELSTDFNKNKDVVNKHVSVSSRKIRNIIAGYATRLAKAKQKA